VAPIIREGPVERSETIPGRGGRTEAVGFFIFAGGFSLGMKDYFHIDTHFEDGPFGVATAKHNLGVTVHEDPATWPTSTKEPWSEKVMFGNPPCSPFSPIGRGMTSGLGKNNWETDPNMKCSKLYLAKGWEFQPKVWITESVPAIEQSEFFKDTARGWKELGYRFTICRIDPKFAAMPQQRRRIFGVASRVAIDWGWTDPGYFTTAGEAIEGLDKTAPPTPPDRVALLEHVGRGQGLRAVWSHLHPDAELPEGKTRMPGRPTIMEHRINDRAPSGTIVGMSSYYHPYEPRVLSIAEVSALCGFPPEWEWVGAGHGMKMMEIAKGVTPPAARWVASQVRSGIDSGVPATPGIDRVTFWGKSRKVDTYERVNVIETDIF
jgi:DNA (cytosine-5)-methyltransferase 1